MAPVLSPHTARLSREAVRRMGLGGEALSDLPPVYKRAFLQTHAVQVGPERAKQFHTGQGSATSAIDANQAKATLSFQVNEDVKDRYEVVKAHTHDRSLPIRAMAQATEALSFKVPMKANDLIDTARSDYAERRAQGDTGLLTRAGGVLTELADTVGVNRVMDPRSTVDQTRDGMMNAAMTFGVGPVAGKLGRVAAGTQAGVKLEARLANTALGSRAKTLGGVLTKPLGKEKKLALHDPSAAVPSYVPKRWNHGSHPAFKPTLERLKAGGMVEVPAVSKGNAISKDLRSLMADLTVETGNEVGLFRLASGNRVLRMGTPKKIPLIEPDARMIAHTHPSGELRLSPGDVEVLDNLRRFGGVPQKSTMLIDPANGGALKAGMSNGMVRMAPSGPTTAAARYGR